MASDYHLLTYPQPDETIPDISVSSFSFGLHTNSTGTSGQLPHLRSDHSHMSDITSDFNRNLDSCLFSTTLSTPQLQMAWSELQMLEHQYPTHESCCGLFSGNIEATREDLFCKIDNDGLPYGDSWQHHFGTIGAPFYMEDGLPSNYMLGSSKEAASDHLPDTQILALGDQQKLQKPSHNATHTSERESNASNSSPRAINLTPAPIESLFAKASKYSDREGHEGNRSLCDERISDEPYAKLIYKALLSAPNHSMVLQQIYQWFIDNTNKGKSASSGWRNSIRHNLSMNAAFRKTDKTPLGDDSKKTSEWVLEPFAIKDGVTPTTRYRKHGKKTMKSTNPAPARVRSGRAGGLSAGKAKYERQRCRGEDIRDPPKENRRRQSQNQQLMTTINCYNDSSSFTPNIDSLKSIVPYHSKDTTSGGKALFGDVQGYHVDGGTVFYIDGFECSGDKHLQMWSGFHY